MLSLAGPAEAPDEVRKATRDVVFTRARFATIAVAASTTCP
jgi:hypothetical protein